MRLNAPPRVPNGGIRRPSAPSIKPTSELFASSLRGQAAAQDLNRVKPLLEARKAMIIAQAIADFRSRDPAHKLTPRGALLAVAALAENDQLMNDLEADERHGRRATEQLNA